MSLVNIISAIGNNNSVYPLIVRDCGIEIPSKVALTYNQNLKDSRQMALNATRERLIDEYGTSFLWLFGIPITDKACSFGIKKFGYNPDVNANLFKDDKKQNLKINIDKFSKKAPKETNDLKKVLANKSLYQKLLAGKFVLSTAIPTILMGFVLPKMNFALTEKIQKRQERLKKNEKILKQEVSFKGTVSTLANMSTVNKMAVTDGGLTVGRVSTARNKYEKFEMGFKMGMMMFLNFVAPKWIAKGLDNLSNKLFNTNVNLDPKLLCNKNFINNIENNSLNTPNGDVINFLDKNPKSDFAKLASEYCGVKYLENGVRDPRAYVDEKSVKTFQNEIEKFSQNARQSGNVKKYAKKALFVKSANILANVGISSFLLAVTLPKVTFMLRKKITGSDAEPGLIKAA